MMYNLPRPTAKRTPAITLNSYYEPNRSRFVLSVPVLSAVQPAKSTRNRTLVMISCFHGCEVPFHLDAGFRASLPSIPGTRTQGETRRLRDKLVVLTVM